MTQRRIEGVFFDVGDTLILEEPGKHLWEMVLRPMPHAVEVLTQLRAHVRVGVVSNTVGSGDAEVARVLERAGLSQLIDALVTSRDFGRAKPDPAIFAEAARRLGVALERTCMVGDRLETDIAGALKAGIPAIWLRRPGAVAPAEITPTHTIGDLAELPDWLAPLYDKQPP